MLHPKWEPGALRDKVTEEFTFADRDGSKDLDLKEFIALYNKLKLEELDIDKYMGADLY